MVRRIAPAVGLFFLSPFVGEYLLGNISIAALGMLPVMALMYGSGALLVREVARRTGRRWPSIVLLALAYGLVEEGLADNTLFNPHYVGQHLLSHLYVPSLGMGVWWTLFVLTLHTVWSISVSVAVVEALVPDRRTTPWLGKVGLPVVAVLFVVGCAGVFAGTYQREKFVPSAGQLVGTVLAIVVVVVAAFLVGRRPARPVHGTVPNAWWVGLFGLVMSSAFLVAPGLLGYLGGVVAYVVLFALAIGAVAVWSRRESWSDLHRLALAGGAMLSYAWHAFPQTPVVGAKGTVDLIGNAVFALIAVGLLAWAGARTARHGGAPGPTARAVGEPARTG